jgi:hypothetical protein
MHSCSECVLMLKVCCCRALLAYDIPRWHGVVWCGATHASVAGVAEHWVRLPCAWWTSLSEWLQGQSCMCLCVGSFAVSGPCSSAFWPAHSLNWPMTHPAPWLCKVPWPCSATTRVVCLALRFNLETSLGCNRLQLNRLNPLLDIATEARQADAGMARTAA